MVVMFDLDAFIAECVAARAESEPRRAINEVLERAVSRPEDVTNALNAKPGVELLYRSDDLTLLSVVVPAGAPGSLPHDHRMWAAVGIYAGQEDNSFFRRGEERIEPSGGRSLAVSDTLLMGGDTIHAIKNPLSQSALAALHVYGGDLLGAERSMWTVPGFDEEPYDDARVLGAPIRGR